MKEVYIYTDRLQLVCFATPNNDMQASETIMFVLGICWKQWFDWELQIV